SFKVAGGREFSEAPLVSVEIGCDGELGRGEAAPFSRYGETTQTVAQRIESVRGDIEGGADRDALQLLLPPGPARNALDCALWDLAAKRGGVPVWQLAHLPAPTSRITSRTIGLDTPDAMAAFAAQSSSYEVLKLKLGEGGDEERVAAVRQAAPKSRL